MGERFHKLSEKHIDFISRQHLYFVATAATDGYVNVSPKGMDTFRVVDSTRVAWLNLTGSGNETAAHVLENSRMTVMFCSFDKQPVILRLYGDASVVHPGSPDWEKLTGLFPKHEGARQVFELEIRLAQTSCGFGVPFYEFTGERPTLKKWAENKGQELIERYWQEKNTLSLDGKATGITEDS